MKSKLTIIMSILFRLVVLFHIHITSKLKTKISDGKEFILMNIANTVCFLK